MQIVIIISLLFPLTGVSGDVSQACMYILGTLTDTVNKDLGPPTEWTNFADEIIPKLQSYCAGLEKVPMHRLFGEVILDDDMWNLASKLDSRAALLPSKSGWRRMVKLKLQISSITDEVGVTLKKLNSGKYFFICDHWHY